VVLNWFETGLMESTSHSLISSLIGYFFSGFALRMRAFRNRGREGTEGAPLKEQRVHPYNNNNLC
jgi:hypothetical protein